MTIRHVVTWNVAGDDPAGRAENAEQVADRLRGLVGVVPAIRALEVGVNIASPEANADVVLIMDVDDLDALEDYQQHPAHQEAAAFIRSVVTGRAAVDFRV